MTILWKIITNTIIRNPSSYRFNVPLKCKFHLYQRSPVATIQNLRYKSSKAIKSNNVISLESIKVKRTSELKHLIVLAAPEKWRIVCGIIFLLVSSAVTMAVPFCLGKVVDTIYTTNTERMKENLKRLSFILFGVFVVGGVCNCCRIYLMSTAGYRTTQSLRKKVYSAIIHQETAMFDKRSTGELVGRLTGDTQVVSSAITNSLSDGLRSSIMAVAGMSMMVYVSPQLAGLGLCVVPVVGGVAILYGRFVKNLSKEVQNSLAVLNTLAEEKIGNIRTVKFFARESHEITVYSEKIEDLLKLCYKESLYRGIFYGFTGFAGNAIILLTLYYGGVMVSGSSITAGNLSAFLLYSAYVGFSLSGLSSFYNDLNRALGANTRLFELLDRVPTIPLGTGRILNEPLSGDVLFRDISFAYPSKERDSLILNNFNLHLPKNTMTAIVGSSGCGKSTVASLLLRLYDPDRGQILLDDHDLKDLNPGWVLSQIGVVPQEPSLFGGTIRDNILYGNIEASKEEIEEAALRANVARFAKKMPDGLDTRVGERGISLSGGEKQRVAIARALIKKPKILILDEATSALDTESESYVRETLEKATQGRTVLTIAHRLSTIMNADKIVVLDQGRIVESGSYNELLRIDNGFFKKLMQHQTFT